MSNAIEIDTDNTDNFPTNLPSTVNIERLRRRRDQETRRAAGRVARKKRSQYVLPLRILCFFLFSVLLYYKLEHSITSWFVVFLPLWIENIDKVYNNGINIKEAMMESRIDRQRRYDILLPPIAKIVLDLGSIVTKILLAVRVDMESIVVPSSSSSFSNFSNFTNPGNPGDTHNSNTQQQSNFSNSNHSNNNNSIIPTSTTSDLPTYRTTFMPFWIACAIGTFIICWTPDRPEIRNAQDTLCQKIWRQVTTGAIYGGTAILMPLLIVNKVDGVSDNSSWTMVFLPIWAIFVLAG